MRLKHHFVGSDQTTSEYLIDMGMSISTKWISLWKCGNRLISYWFMFQVPTVFLPICPLPLSTLQVEKSKNMLRIGLLSGFYNSPSWFHFNCRMLPRSRMMWLRTDPWNQQATPLVVRKTFLDLEEPGHRPARRPRTTKFWPHQLFSHFATVWLKGGREMNQKKRWDERWYTTMRCSGICKIGKS